jgi:photosystem II stability/assembly factor-like uncharacterized protein
MRRICVIAATALCALSAVWFVTPAGASTVTVQRSGWFWGSPTPQGETLDQVAFQGSVGYAAGASGTVLRSVDAGAEWSGLQSGTEAELTLMQEINPETIVVGGGCSVRESTDGGVTFSRLPVNESESNCAKKVASFSFLSPTTGYVEQSDGSILYTTNGGQSLAPRTPVPLGNGEAVQIEFLSTSLGFALVDSTSGGHILRTSDGANSWAEVAAAPAGQPLTDLTVLSASAAYAVGGRGGTGANASVMLFSEDEGKTWTQRPLELSGTAPKPALLDISCGDALHCVMTTAEGATLQPQRQLVRTSDGGMTASVVTPSQQPLADVAFAGGSAIVAVGTGGATVLSSDGGETFAAPPSSQLAGELPEAITLGGASGDAYLAGRSGQIVFTADGGVSWQTMQLPTSSDLAVVAFPGTQVGYAVNTSGTLYRTGDGGATWSILGSDGEPPSALLALPSGTVLLVGPTGIRRSTNAGASFAPVTGSVALRRSHGHVVSLPLSAFPLFGGAQIAGSAMIAWGDEAIESLDGGVRWTLIPRPLGNGNVEAVSFISPSTGYEVSRQRLFFTRNAGRSWSEIDSLGTGALGGASDLSFSSVQDGYVLAAYDGTHDVVLHTDDGGRTWTPELLPRGVQAVAAGGAVDYAEGEDALFATDDGGLSPQASKLTLAISGVRRIARAKLRRRHGQVTLTGRLTPADGGEQVIVSWRTGGRSVWQHRQATVASDGRFSLRLSGISASTDFVAQWAGEAPESGAGSAAVELTVTGR